MMDNENTQADPSYEEVQEIAKTLKERTKHQPLLGIVCGSGLGGLGDLVEEADVVPYSEIPNFPVSTVPGHMGKLVFGKLKGQTVVLMRGRLHCYEGYPMWKTTIPIRVMKALGVETLFLTNAAGGINPEFNTGDIMVIRDHIDFAGLSGECVLRGANDERDHIDFAGLSGECVLRGANDERFGPRFLATVGTWDDAMNELAEKAATELGLGDILRRGVYVMIGGPTFETVAESRLLKNFGADAVGMSTVAEAVVGRHMSMKVFGISLITDKCCLDYNTAKVTTHEEVLAIGQKRAGDLQSLVLKILELMH